MYLPQDLLKCGTLSQDMREEDKEYKYTCLPFLFSNEASQFLSC